MGILDQLGTTPQESIANATIRPARGKFKKEGYLDWDNPKHATPDKDNKNIREVLGVILPPYKEYLSERLAAIKDGQRFTTPFWLRVGVHAMGSKSDRQKVYCNCPKVIIFDNRVDQKYPMLAGDISTEKPSCPICDACWDIVWPKVKEYDHNKESPEYKAYKDAHKQLSPQQRHVFNFLPAGSSDPILLETSKTLGDKIEAIHYDIKHPDLLWPYSVGTVVTSAWIGIRRSDVENVTNYDVSPYFSGCPHVRKADGTFDEALYLSIMDKIKDLRQVAKDYFPDHDEIEKTVNKCKTILSYTGLTINTANTQIAAVGKAETAAGVSATPSPTIPVPPMVQEPLPVHPAAPPAMPPMPTPVSPTVVVDKQPAPPAAESADKDAAFAMLQNLLKKQ